jgi:hypothetical protein
MPTRRTRPLRVVALGALLVLVAVACDAGAPAATRVLATLSFPPIATPSSAPVDRGLASFVAAAAGRTLSYHASYTGSVSGSATTLQVSGQIDASGDNYAAVTSYRQGSRSWGTVAVRYVGGHAWIRLDRHAWQPLLNFRQTQSNSPFAFIDRLSDVKLVATRVVAGKPQTTLTFTSARLLGPDEIPAVNLSEAKIGETLFTLVVDGMGRPLSGTWLMRGTGRVGNQLQEIVTTVDLTFSRVGAKIAIAAP